MKHTKDLADFEVTEIGKKYPLKEHAIKTRIIFQRTISQRDMNLSTGFYLFI